MACECELAYVENHVPYRWLEKGSGRYAATEEEMDVAADYCALRNDRETGKGYAGDSEATLTKIAHELVKRARAG